MPIIKQTAEHVNAKHAIVINNNANSLPSFTDGIERTVPDDSLNTGREEEANSGPIVHRLSRSLARLHGVNVAVVLRGLAWKIQHSKNIANGKKWYYECLDTLVAKRFPYFARSTLSDTIGYGKEKQLVETSGWKHRYRYDRTNSFSMTQANINAAAHDLVYFDVQTAIDLDIESGLLLQNLRHFLKLKWEEAPEAIPYHKLSPKQLSGDLPMSLSTVKRKIKLLEGKGEFIRHPEMEGYWTMKEKQWRSGSYSDMGGSNPDNDTHYKSIPKPFKSCSKEQQADPCEQTITDRKHHHSSLTSDSVNGEAEHSKDSKGKVMTMARLKEINKSFTSQINIMNSADKDNMLRIIHHLCSGYFGSLTPERICEYHEVRDIDTLTVSIAQEMTPFCLQKYGEHFSKHSMEAALYINPAIEVVVGALADAQEEGRYYLHSYSIPVFQKLCSHFRRHVYSICEADREQRVQRWFEEQRRIHQSPTTDQEEMSELPPADKVRVFRNAVHSRNEVGWVFWDGERHTDHIQLGATAFGRLERLFALNPDLSVAQLLKVLDRCPQLNVETPTQENIAWHDPHWHARRGHIVNRLLSNLEKILEELQMVNECPVEVFLESPRPGLAAA